MAMVWTGHDAVIDGMARWARRVRVATRARTTGGRLVILNCGQASPLHLQLHSRHDKG